MAYTKSLSRVANKLKKLIKERIKSLGLIDTGALYDSIMVYPYEDTDGVLSKAKYKELAKKLIANGTHVFIISARHEKSNLINIAKSIGIPESRVYTTGSNKAKIEQIISLNIGTHYDNNQDVIDKLGETSTNGIKV